MKISNKIQHCLRICFRNCFIILSAVILVLFSISQSFAGNVTFVKEYTYQASELDSKASCRTISLEMVKRLLLEELGTYLISETEVKDFKLTKEQVKTYSAGIVGAEIIEDKWDGKTYWLKAKVSADPKDVQNALKKIADDKTKTKKLEESRKITEELIKENESLRKKLDLAVKFKNNKRQEIADKKSNSKVNDEIVNPTNIIFGVDNIGSISIDSTVSTDYEDSIRKLTAIKWFRKGFSAIVTKRFQYAIYSFSEAIDLKENLLEAYYNRAIVYSKVGNYHQAIKDFTMTLDLKPDDVTVMLVYYNRGVSYYKLGKYQQAINDFKIGANLGDPYAKDMLVKLGESGRHE